MEKGGVLFSFSIGGITSKKKSFVDAFLAVVIFVRYE
jgi:hypothetical protein